MNVNFNLTQSSSFNNPPQNLTKKGSNYSKRPFPKTRRDEVKSLFENVNEESKYLKFLMKHKYPIYESDEQNKKRILALEFLADIVDKW